MVVPVGMPGLDLESEVTSAGALLAWGDTWVTRLPDHARPLTELSSDEIVTRRAARPKIRCPRAGNPRTNRNPVCGPFFHAGPRDKSARILGTGRYPDRAV